MKHPKEQNKLSSLRCEMADIQDNEIESSRRCKKATIHKGWKRRTLYKARKDIGTVK